MLKPLMTIIEERKAFDFPFFRYRDLAVDYKMTTPKGLEPFLEVGYCGIIQGDVLTLCLCSNFPFIISKRVCRTFFTGIFIFFYTIKTYTLPTLKHLQTLTVKLSKP